MRACRGSVRKPEDCLEDLCVTGKIILKWTLKKFNGMSWTGFFLAQDRENWQAVVGTEMNLQIPYSVGNFWSS
jgi:hypothetical protein